MTLKRLSEILWTEKYSYTFYGTEQEVAEKINKLLHSPGSFDPNIKGAVINKTFKATYKWTLGGNSRGWGSSVYLDGLITQINETQTRVNIEVYPDFFSKLLPIIFALILLGSSIDSIIRLTCNPAAYEEPLKELGIALFILPLFVSIFTALTYHQKKDLRKTFEFELRVEPDTAGQLQ